MKKDKFKNKRSVGAPLLDDSVKRVNLVTTVNPDSLAWIDKQVGSRGRVIDDLIKGRLK